MGKEFFKKYELSLSLFLIGAIAALAYLPYITRTGYYIEDWYLIWSGLTRGTASYIPMFMSDRPFEAYTYVLLFPIFGPSALPWHILLIVMRILGTFSFLWLLRMLWPQQKIETTSMALLFMIYPGFFQHVQAVEFHVHMTALCLAITSVALSIYAVLTPNLVKRISVTIGALIFLIVYPLMMEYYFGLEFVRALLIGLIIARKDWRPIKVFITRCIVWWTPYFVVFGAYIYWRIFFFSGARRATDVGLLLNSYKSNPILMLVRLVVELGRDVIDTLYLAWAVPFSVNWGSYSEILFNSLIAVISVVIVAGFYWLIARSKQTIGGQDSPYRQYMFLGFVIIVLGLLPVIVANKSVSFAQREDRFTITAALGAVMMIVGFIFYYFKSRIRHALIMGLVGIAVLSHLNYAAFMAGFWEEHRQFWWQVSWRVPQFEKDTLILTRFEDYAFIEGYETWGPANLIFYPKSDVPQISAEVFYEGTLHDVLRGGE
jgi:hypothetical protein